MFRIAAMRFFFFFLLFLLISFSTTCCFRWGRSELVRWCGKCQSRWQLSRDKNRYKNLVSGSLRKLPVLKKKQSARWDSSEIVSRQRNGIRCWTSSSRLFSRLLFLKNREKRKTIFARSSHRDEERLCGCRSTSSLTVTDWMAACT